MRFARPSGRKVTLEETGHAENPLFIFGHPTDQPIPLPDDNTLVFTAGVHRLPQDPLILRSGQTVVLALGAYIEGRFVGHKIENVQVLGRGMLSGTYLARPPWIRSAATTKRKASSC